MAVGIGLGCGVLYIMISIRYNYSTKRPSKRFTKRLTKKLKTCDQSSSTIPNPKSSTVQFFTVQVNDLVGGWIVTDYPHPLSLHDFLQGVVLADCMAKEEAELLAGLLNAYIEVGGKLPPRQLQRKP